MVDLRSLPDPVLKCALQAWDGAFTEWDKPFEDSMRIREELRETSSHQAFGWASLTAGRIAAYRGHAGLAEVLLSEAVGRFCFVGDSYGEGMAISHLAIPLVTRRDLDRALEFALRPLSSNTPFSDQDRSLLHNRAAHCYWAREESHHAISHLIREFELVKGAQHFERSSQVLGNMGAVLLVLGEWDLALSVSTKAWQLQLATCADKTKHQLNFLSNIVLLNYLLGNRNEALQSANGLLQYDGLCQDPEDWMIFLSLLDAFAVNGKLEMAEYCLERAKILSEKNRTSYLKAHLQVGEATVRESRKDYLRAIELAEEVANQPTNVVKRAARLSAAIVLSRCYGALGRTAEVVRWRNTANELRYERPLGNFLSSQIQANLRVEQLGDPLTERELTCLSLAAQGQTSADIGLKLGITTRTVNFHISKVLRKLSASNRQEAIAKAITANLLRLS